ncbi:MAG: hypothetical protein IKS20_01065 [Victivallales bacterium]|nr:hypothetical protein [Victivallales bacterium]
MDTKKAFIIALVLDFVFLAVAGYFYTDAKAQSELANSITEEKAASDAKIASMEKENGALKNRLSLLMANGGDDKNAELQKMIKSLDEKDGEIRRLKNLIVQNNANPPQQQENRRGDRGNRQRFNPEEMMARLKESDPERYEQIMKQRDERRQMLKERTEKRDNYLSRLDMNKLNAEQKQIILDYQHLIKSNEELRASMSENGDMSNFREIMRNQAEMANVSTKVRDILIEQFAGSNVSEEVKNIIDATTVEGGRGGFRGGFGGRPGGFGGPGR